MKKNLAIIICFFVISGSAFSQSSPNRVLFEIGNEKVTIDEFLSSYKKNNQLNTTTPEELREYLNLYINFKLKVTEGKHLKVDSSDLFQRELASYKDQSAQQYLIDREVTEQLIKEAIDRYQYHIWASHILISLPYNASPKDTLIAYKKALDIRQQILNGMDFAEAAVAYSDDPSSKDYTNPHSGYKQRGNKGDIGYFTVFNLIYPFESMAYNTPVGSISMPVKTIYGYHLILVKDKVPAIDQIAVSQIFIQDTAAANNKMSDLTASKIENIKKLLSEDTAFSVIVHRFSEDPASKEKEGKLTPFAPNRMAGNFVKAAISLSPGEYSEPVPSNLGWHIILLEKITPLHVDDDTPFIIKNKVSRDARSYMSRSAFIKKLKKEYHYDESGKKAALKFFKKNLPATYFESTDKSIENHPDLAKLKPICKFADQSITVPDFISYLSAFKGYNIPSEAYPFTVDRLGAFVEDKIMQYEETQLEKKHPGYRDLIQEYYDGMVLYEINSEMVWNKALQDTIGQVQFYEQIKQEFPIEGTDPVEYKPMNEIRAIVITRYQDYLEKLWISKLKEKYPVKINEDLYRTILN